MGTKGGQIEAEKCRGKNNDDRQAAGMIFLPRHFFVASNAAPIHPIEAIHADQWPWVLSELEEQWMLDSICDNVLQSIRREGVRVVCEGNLPSGLLTDRLSVELAGAAVARLCGCHSESSPATLF